jgi:hypothetical protein
MRAYLLWTGRDSPDISLFASSDKNDTAPLFRDVERGSTAIDASIRGWCGGGFGVRHSARHEGLYEHVEERRGQASLGIAII